MAFLRLLAAFAIAAVLPSCAPPKAPTAEDALGAGNFGEPLVVDWKPEQRGALEVSMRQGVAVVGYDGKSIKLLRDCALDGGYEFYGTTYVDQVVHLRDEGEIKANLPLHGAGLAGTLHAELEAGRSLDIALAMIGFKRTTWVKAKKSELKGQCDGATHFVKGAVVGAFAMDRGSKLATRTAVEVFGFGAGVSTNTERGELTHFGSLDDCKASKPTAGAPPDQCGGPLRLELTALDFDADQAARDVAQDVCAKGWVEVEGKCAKERSEEAHQCKPGDYSDCTAQCDRGHQGSCNSLAAIYAAGDKKLSLAADLPRAQSLREKACDSGIAVACTAFGNGLLSDRTDVRLTKTFQRACDLGSAEGCANLGILLERGEGGSAKDLVQADALYDRGCDGGYPPACHSLGRNNMAGRGVDKNEARGAELLKKACTGYVLPACGDYGVVLREGLGVPKNPVKAGEVLASACNMFELTAPDGTKSHFGDGFSCAVLGEMYARGEGVPRDAALAEDALSRACDQDQAPACGILAQLLERGELLQKDVARAASLYRKACVSGDHEACMLFARGMLGGRFGAKNPAEAIKIYRPYCTDAHDPEACAELGQMMLDGDGVPRDEKGGAKLISNACAEESPIACAVLASLSLHGRGVPRDQTKAATLNRFACSKGVPAACVNLGYQLDVGAGVSFDLPASVELAKDTCAHGVLLGCSNFAELLERGRGVPQDGEKAAELFTKACAVGVPSACVGLGRLREVGLGVPKDELRAVAAYKDACDGGAADGCDALGKMIAAGKAVPKDAKRAAELFQQACDKDSAAGCTSLALALSKGVGVKRDDKRAFSLAQGACDTPSPDACAVEGRFLAAGTGTKRDAEHAGTLLGRICIFGEIKEACVQGASLLRTVPGIKDESRARRALVVGCNHGVAEACTKLKQLPP